MQTHARVCKPALPVKSRRHIYKDKNIQANLNYKIKESAPAYSPVTGKCRLCLVEKLEILLADEEKYINDRSELLAKCRHSNKFMLSGVT